MDYTGIDRNTIISNLRKLRSETYNNRLFWCEEFGSSWHLLAELTHAQISSNNCRTVDNYVIIQQIFQSWFMLATRGSQTATVQWTKSIKIEPNELDRRSALEPDQQFTGPFQQLKKTIY